MVIEQVHGVYTFNETFHTLNNKNLSNKEGFHFIPDIGKEILIDFESQNVEKPFVITEVRLVLITLQEMIRKLFIPEAEQRLF